MSRRRIKNRQSGFCATCAVLVSIWSCHFSGAGEVVPVDGRFVSMKSSEEGHGPFLPASGVLLEEMPGNVRLAAEKFLGQLSPKFDPTTYGQCRTQSCLTTTLESINLLVPAGPVPRRGAHKVGEFFNRERSEWMRIRTSHRHRFPRPSVS